MDLLQNPFHILRATTRDNKKQIVDLAGIALLQGSDALYSNVHHTLIHPQQRIAAEMAWLPGVNPEYASQLLILLESSAGNESSGNNPMPTAKNQSLAAALAVLPYTDSSTVADKTLEILKSSHTTLSETDSLDSIKSLLSIDTLNPLARANLLAARISRLPDYKLDNVTEWILEIARVFEKVKPEEVLITLNQERKISVFPEITDLSAVTEEMQNRRHYYQQVIRSALENLSVEERAKAVITAVEAAENPSSVLMKDSTTADTWPLLIEDLVDVYETGIQEFLNAEEKDIETQDTKIRKAADAGLSDENFTTILDEFIQTIKNWDVIVQPIQISKKRQGLDHEESLRVGRDARQLAIYLYNEHDKLESSRQLIGALQEVFAEIPEIAERLVEDAESLDKIATAKGEFSEVLEKVKTHINELQQAVTLADIKTQVEEIQESADAGNPDHILDPMVSQLVHAIGKWETSTQQIEADYTIMTLAGNVALNLLNEHDKPDLALKIMKVTRDVFPEFLGITDVNNWQNLL